MLDKNHGDIALKYIQERLGEIGVPQNCTICEIGNYEIMEVLYTMGIYNLFTQKLGHMSHPNPFVSIICNNCGHTHLFHIKNWDLKEDDKIIVDEIVKSSPSMHC